MCSSGAHYYIEHAMSCASKYLDANNRWNLEEIEVNPADLEKFGCLLKDKQNRAVVDGQEGNYLASKQVHWWRGGLEQEKFMYRKGSDSQTCAFEGEKGKTHDEFPIPDYCSRAMVSELSSVYDGHLRYPSMLAATKVMFQTTAAECKSNQSYSLDEIFTKSKTAKSDWNMVHDWKKLYCLKYSECACTDMSDSGCHFNEEKIQCCRSKYQEFLDSTYAE